jgi:hypothetical protein
MSRKNFEHFENVTTQKISYFLKKYLKIIRSYYINSKIYLIMLCHIKKTSLKKIFDYLSIIYKNRGVLSSESNGKPK